MANALKLLLVLGIGLDAKTCCKNKLADSSAEAGEKGVEWLEQAEELASE